MDDAGDTDLIRGTRVFLAKEGASMVEVSFLLAIRRIVAKSVNRQPVSVRSSPRCRKP